MTAPFTELVGFLGALASAPIAVQRKFDTAWETDHARHLALLEGLPAEWKDLTRSLAPARPVAAKFEIEARVRWSEWRGWGYRIGVQPLNCDWHLRHGPASDTATRQPATPWLGWMEQRRIESTTDSRIRLYVEQVIWPTALPETAQPDQSPGNKP